MEQFKVFIMRAAICFILPQILLGGCTLVGFGIGALMDSSSPKGGQVAITAFDQFDPGTTITLTLRDSRQIEGYYISIREEDPARYREQFVAALSGLGSQDRVPLPGDQVTFAYWDTPGSKERGQFRGVDSKTMVVGQPPRRIVVSQLGTLVVNDTSQADLLSFNNLVSDHKLPFLTRGILVKMDRETTEIPIVDIVRVSVVGGPRNAKWVGLAAGAVVDGIMTIVLVNSTAESCEKSDCGQIWCAKKSQH